MNTPKSKEMDMLNGGLAGKLILFCNAFAQAVVTFTSQNYGAGHMDKARKTMHYGCFRCQSSSVLDSCIIW